VFFGSIRFWFVTAVRKPWAKGLFFFFFLIFYLLHRWGVSGTALRSRGVNSRESHFPACFTALCTASMSRRCWGCTELWPYRQL